MYLRIHEQAQRSRVHRRAHKIHRAVADTEWDGLCRGREKSRHLRQSHDHTSAGHTCCSRLVGARGGVRADHSGQSCLAMLVQAGDDEGSAVPVLFRGLCLQDWLCSPLPSKCNLESPVKATSLLPALPATHPVQLHG